MYSTRLRVFLPHKTSLVILTLLFSAHSASAQVQSFWDRLLSRKPKIETVATPGTALPGDIKTRMANGDKLYSEFNHASTKVSGTIRILSTEIFRQNANGVSNKALDRDREVGQVLDVLARTGNSVPPVAAILSSPKIGKTAVMRAAVEKIITGDLPAGVQQQLWTRPFVVETSPMKLLSISGNYANDQAKTVTDYLQSLQSFAVENKCQVILVVDHADAWTPSQLMGLEAAWTNGSHSMPPMIWMADQGKATNGFLMNNIIKEDIVSINLDELTVGQTIEIMKAKAVPEFERRYNVKISDEVLSAVISGSAEATPDLRRPEAPIRFLQDVAIAANREAGGASTEIESKTVYSLVANKLGMKVVPQDRENFLRHIEDAKAFIKTKITGQDIAIDKICDSFGRAMTGDKVIFDIFMGTTGVGKTEVMKLLAEFVFGSDVRMLTIDMNQVKTDDHGNFLFGAKPGYLSSDTNKGIVTVFYLTKGRGFSLFLMNEIEKGHRSQLLRMMELIDTGLFPANDGTTVYTGHSYIAGTSNKGANRMFPADFLQLATDAQIDEKLSSFTKEQLRGFFMEKPVGAEEDNSLPPEMMGRIHDIIPFAPISKAKALIIGKYLVSSVVATREKKMKEYGKILVDDKFSESIVDETYNPAYGVRDLKNELTDAVEKIADEHLKKFKKSKILTIKTVLVPGASQYTFVATNEKQETLKIPGPALKELNALYVPAQRERIQKMKENVDKVIIGQEDMVQAAVSLAKKQVVDSKSPIPASMIIVGPPGTGKTELGKAVAKELYGSESRLLLSDFGSIRKNSDVDAIFGSSETGKIGTFEQMLETYPDGFVWLRDEYTNIAGGSKEGIDGVSKMLYQIDGEGKWVSPVTGKVFYVKKVFNISTGNAGEKLFQQTTDDRINLAMWEMYRKRPAVAQILIEAGVPPALISREGKLILVKPTTKSGREGITAKKLGIWKQNVEESHRHWVEVIYDQEFVAALARLRYDVAEGGRSIQQFIDEHCSEVVANGLFKVDQTKLSVENPVKIQLSIVSREPTKPVFETLPVETLAELHVEMVQDSQVIHSEVVNFTDEAKFMVQIKKVDAAYVRYHEGGHFALHEEKILGEKMVGLTIIPSTGFLGYVLNEPMKGFVSTIDQRYLTAKLLKLVGGSVMEDLLGRTYNSGQGKDLLEQRQILTQAVSEWGFEPKLHGVRVNAKGELLLSPKQEEIFQQFMNVQITKARAEARNLLVKRWYLVREASLRAEDHLILPESELDEIWNAYRAMSPAQIEEYNAKYGPEQVKAELARMDKEFLSGCVADLHVKR